MIDPHDLSLRLYPDPVLREKAARVERVDEDIRAVVDRMIEIMREADGIGLAAPQVGLPLRIFVCDVPGERGAPEDPATSTDGVMVCINPEFVDAAEDRSPFEEGCLSLPGLRGEVIRPEVVTLRALGADGEPFEARGAGLLARCWQHEADHLDGVLIIDRMTQMSRLKNRRKLRDLERA